MRLLARMGGLALLAACQEYDLQKDEDPSVPPADDTAPAVATEPETPTTPSTPPAPTPDIEVDPPSLDFGFLPAGCTSARQEFVVRNVGDADLHVADIGIVGDLEGAYRFLGTPGSLAPGEEIVVEVDFTPPELAVYDAAAVAVTSDDPDEPEVEVGLRGEGADEGEIEEHFTQSSITPVDVLWVIDNSGSMAGEVDNLADTFDVFINGFVALGLDYQIGVVTTDMVDPLQSGRLQGATKIITSLDPDPVGAFADAVNQGASGSGDERGLDAAYAALTAPLITAENAGMVRAGSNLSIIVVTDENDSSVVAPLDFAAWLDGYQGDPALSSFSAVAGPKSGLLPCIAFFSGISADPAPRYWTAVQNTGGIHVSICDMDMTSILGQLAVVSAGMKTSFVLTYTVTDPLQIVVEVDGVPVSYGATNGFTFDAATNTITFYGNAVPLPGADVAVTYPMATAC